ncbi:NUDIX domain-containing protein [Microvirga terrae]|uniref:NUDIX domain-containing protein n=1 Tax=Microvirga terrae TaxID=2740529 RepID=A0ABY5RNQ0_9HYPH|nr:NUDIX domain-containing protein [Microvirga terrae]UVF18858.1 NUDIX domain-containing protein [Microvirga terrae]
MAQRKTKRRYNSSSGNNSFTRTISGIMFLDLKGYSSMSEPQLRSFGENVLPELANMALKHGPDYINTWGDAIVIAMQDIKCMAQTAVGIRDFLRAFDWDSHQLPMIDARISIHMGSIYKGKDAFSERGMIIGRAVNLAARIEPMVTPGQVWATNDFIVALNREQQNLFKWSSLGVKTLAKEAGEEELFVIYRAHEPNPEVKGREVAVTVVRKDGQVLLVRRIDSSSPTWQFPAGQIKPNTRPEDAAVREVQEETGVSCVIVSKIGDRFHEEQMVHLHYFLADWKDGDAVNGDPKENDLVEWVSPREALSRFTLDVDSRIKSLLENMT